MRKYINNAFESKIIKIMVILTCLEKKKILHVSKYLITALILYGRQRLEAKTEVV